jgi:hypothetical protein
MSERIIYAPNGRRICHDNDKNVAHDSTVSDAKSASSRSAAIDRPNGATDRSRNRTSAIRNRVDPRGDHFAARIYERTRAICESLAAARDGNTVADPRSSTLLA